MWGPTALLMGKFDFFSHLLNDFRAIRPWRIRQLTWCQCRGQKGSKAITRGVCCGMTCPPRPSLTLSSFYGRPPAGGGDRGTTGSMHYCTPIVSQPATLTHVKQVLLQIETHHNPMQNALLHKNLRRGISKHQISYLGECLIHSGLRGNTEFAYGPYFCFCCPMSHYTYYVPPPYLPHT